MMSQRPWYLVSTVFICCNCSSLKDFDKNDIFFLLLPTKVMNCIPKSDLIDQSECHASFLEDNFGPIRNYRRRHVYLSPDIRDYARISPKIKIIAGDHRWLYIIMQDKKRITYAQLWSKHYTILIDDTATIIC